MFPFIAALTQVGGILIDKIVLTRRQVALHVFVPILFLFLFLSTALLFPLLGTISLRFFEAQYLILFVLMLIAAVVWNIFYYQGVRSEKVHDFELIVMSQPLLTIFLASLLLKGERNLHLEIAAFIAAGALIAAHIRKAHIEMSSGSYKLILAVIFMSVELIMIKILLDVFSPVALYFARTGIIFIFFLLLSRPKIRQVANENVLLIFSSAVLGTAQMISKFYGFEKYGVIYTSLILILSPILVYILSTLFLHEKLKPRTIVSAVIILACIVYATVVGK